MDAARIPWAWRDYCAHLLIPLNKCRRQEAYLPWACHHEKHVYEKCQYKVCTPQLLIVLLCFAHTRGLIVLLCLAHTRGCRWCCTAQQR